MKKLSELHNNDRVYNTRYGEILTVEELKNRINKCLISSCDGDYYTTIKKRNNRYKSSY